MPNALIAAALPALLCLPFQAPADPAPAPSGSAQASSSDPFPAANGPLRLALDDEQASVSLASLLDRYADLTDVTITFGPDVASMLAESRVQIDRPLDVPAADVPTVVETFLASSGYFITVAPTQGRMLLSVESLNSPRRGMIRSRALRIVEDQIEAASQHPAMIVTYAMSLQHLDPRQVSNSLRTMITDANTSQLLPIGSGNGLIIIGTGTQVADLARTLESMDDASGAARAASQLDVEVVAIEHGNAGDIAGILNIVFELQGTGQQPQGYEPPRRAKVVFDSRTNSIILRGTSEDRARFKDLIVSLDREVG